MKPDTSSSRHVGDHVLLEPVEFDRRFVPHPYGQPRRLGGELRNMKMDDMYNICGTSFFKKLKDHEVALFGAILKCIYEVSSELFITEDDGFVDVVYRKSGDVVPIFHIPRDFASKFCDFAAAAFPHKELSSFVSELDGFSIINLNGNLVHALFYDYAQTSQDGRVCCCVQLVFDESCAPREAEVLITNCRDEGLFK